MYYLHLILVMCGINIANVYCITIWHGNLKVLGQKLMSTAHCLLNVNAARS